MSKPAGAEPVISKDDPCEMSWGIWSFKAVCSASPWEGDDLTFMVTISYHGDDDSGERGMYGELATSGVISTIEHAAREAKRFRPMVCSAHCEEGDEDVVEYERFMDLSPIIDAACNKMREAVLAEARSMEKVIGG